MYTPFDESSYCIQGNIRPFRPGCEPANSKLGEYLEYVSNYFSQNKTVSGRIKDWAKLFLSSEGRELLVYRIKFSRVFNLI